jgi:phosphohistidine phosphatase
VLVSPALRTQQTWERIAAALGCSAEPVLDERLYENALDLLFEVVRESDEEVQTLLVVGHNPSVGEFARAVDDGEGDPAAREALAAGFPAGSFALFDVETPFAVIGPGGAVVVGFGTATG